ncbi:UNVERIFIED_CONTAM: hypothetical protein BEN50_14620 [Euhalothece sp. KZN 001]
MSKITQNLLKWGGSLTALFVLTGAQAAIAITTYNLEWDGTKFGNSASATGSITLDETTLPNPGGSTDSLSGFGVTDLEVTVTGASSGNGTFDINDFSTLNWNTDGNTLNLNQELIGQGLANFDLVAASGSGAPDTIFPSPDPFQFTTNEGSGDIMVLQSVTPTNDSQAVPFEAEGTMGLAALGGFFWYRNRKKRKQTLAASAKSE